MDNDDDDDDAGMGWNMFPIALTLRDFVEKLAPAPG